MDVLKDKNLTGKVAIVTGANSGIGEYFMSAQLYAVLFSFCTLV